MESLEHVTVELRRAAAELLEDVTSHAEDMLAYLLQRIPEAGADPELRGLTLGSCSSNLEAALSMVRHGIDVSAATAPVTALEHARAMAARGYSVDVMLRFYRMGHAYFTERLVAVIRGIITDPAVALAAVDGLQSFGFTYIDRISSQVALEYVAELDRRANQARAARTDTVRALIAGDRVDVGRAERTLSHRLTDWQTGFVCWTDREDVDLAPVGLLVASHLGARSPLLVPDGARALWGWAATTTAPQLASGIAALNPILPPTVRVSIGASAKGTPGFRETHLQSLRARRTAELSDGAASVTAYEDVALVDVLSQDLALARAFVAAELGDLAAPGEREHEERRALLAVLDAQGGLAAAALTLGLHRNTVLQRLRRAEARRGRPATERIAELHAALRLTQRLGTTVLRPRPADPS
ncbi:helix-turn-helix domain-containing protein [Nocardioides daeguensis]|uniref:helix-turn-helix domain-containing protein n=1 Tax=Nocardioides daeguensis TaxID=908359 RepID=UPI001C47CD4A|nr:helix-turn-helix domain-containing protein [Nocardioides daeguensis]MBV6728272.1 helix-turn-helix domain-containing protein [Nocardioides daeguensis]MCR1773081.1 helix-turn-helix domain-containing protein [Nocardioides daeguensis]